MEKRPILIADDDPNDVALIQRVFRQCRILNPVQVLPNGTEVIAYLKGDMPYTHPPVHPILLLLDLKMPDRSGLEVLEWLQHHRNGKAMSVVVLSGMTDAKDIDRAYKLGAQSFLMKPLQVEDFMNLITGLKHVQMKSHDAGYCLNSC